MRKLGLIPSTKDARTLRLPAFIQSTSKAPASSNWTRLPCGGNRIVWPMYANDTVGDCTFASQGHLETLYAQNTRSGLVISDEDVLTAYSGATGYDAADPSTDQGCEMLKALRWWRKMGLGGSKIEAFADIGDEDEHLRLAIAHLGGAVLGLALPTQAESQTVWDVRPDASSSADVPGSWGAHAVAAVGYDEEHVTLVTWGVRKRLTWRALAAWGFERWAVLSPNVLQDGTAFTGLDLPALRAELRAVTA